MDIYDTLLVVFVPIAKIAALAIFGFAVFRAGMLPYKYHSLMSKAVMNFTLPCLLFSKLVGGGGLERFAGWYVLPLGGAAIILSGGLLGLAASRLIADRGRSRVLLAHMSAFMNAGYLPIPLVRGCFPEPEFRDLDALVAILLLGVTPLLWSVSPAVLSGGSGRFPWRKVVNPPLVTIVCSFFAARLGLGAALSEVQLGGSTLAQYFFAPFTLAGEATVPLVIIVLGGTLAKLEFKRPRHPGFLAALVLTKLVALPALGLLLVPRFGFALPVTVVLCVECMSPTALNSMVQAKEFCDEETQKSLGEGLLYSYLASIVTLTAFITLARYLLLRG